MWYLISFVVQYLFLSTLFISVFLCVSSISSAMIDVFQLYSIVLRIMGKKKYWIYM